MWDESGFKLASMWLNRTITSSFWSNMSSAIGVSPETAGLGGVTTLCVEASRILKVKTRRAVGETAWLVEIGLVSTWLVSSSSKSGNGWKRSCKKTITKGVIVVDSPVLEFTIAFFRLNLWDSTIRRPTAQPVVQTNLLTCVCSNISHVDWIYVDILYC